MQVRENKQKGMSEIFQVIRYQTALGKKKWVAGVTEIKIGGIQDYHIGYNGHHTEIEMMI